jgi:hypothetical protein
LLKFILILKFRIYICSRIFKHLKLKQMKKVLALLAIAGFVACNNAETAAPAADTTKPAEVTAPAADTTKKDTSAAAPVAADTTKK